MKKVDRNAAVKSFKNKGFQENRSGHHIFFHHGYKGKATGVNTKIPHTPKIKDISGKLLFLMKKQLRLENLADTIAFLDCTIDGYQYNVILSKKGIFDL